MSAFDALLLGCLVVTTAGNIALYHIGADYRAQMQHYRERVLELEREDLK